MQRIVATRGRSRRDHMRTLPGKDLFYTKDNKSSAEHLHKVEVRRLKEEEEEQAMREALGLAHSGSTSAEDLGHAEAAQVTQDLMRRYGSPSGIHKEGQHPLDREFGSLPLCRPKLKDHMLVGSMEKQAPWEYSAPPVAPLPIPEAVTQVSAQCEADVSARSSSKSEDEDSLHLIYVGNLSPSVSSLHLAKVFETFGRIKPDGVAIGSHKAGFFFGFVMFEDHSGVNNASNASPIELEGQFVHVEARRPNSRGLRTQFSNTRDAINFALLPDEALLASQLEGARRASIEKAYNAALREAETRRTGRRTKPTAHWPKDGVMEVFQMIYMAACMTKEVRFKRGEENWVDDPIVHDMALELFARTQRAYSAQQLHNKWRNMKLDKILKEEDQKLDIEGPNLPPPTSTPPPQHLGFTATANGIEIDTSQPPIVFKSQLYTLTGVPPECQKIIGKDGTLEDNGNWSDLGVKDGQKLMMIGMNAAITKVLQEEVGTLVIAAANNPSTRELSKSLQLPAIEFLLEENGHKSDLEILRKKMEHLDIENKKDKDEHLILQQEIAILKKKLAHAMEEKMGYINEIDLLKNQLYTADALRSDMHNQLMELKGSIRVFCRVRPILDKSNSEDGAVYCPEKGQFVGRRVYLETSSGAIKAFTCDRVFPPGVSQNDIFVEISGLVKSAMDGKKVCIFAYGQTGSGKTFTMLGGDGDDAKGVIPRAVEEIFETIQIRESSGLAHHTVKIGMSEIYNDEVRNLSSMASNDNVVKTKTQALGALKEALSKRAVAKTSRNERSSRSHFIFRLSLYSYNEKMEMCEGALNIIDLAGSEAADSDATKEVQAEATAINTSLLYLGTTIGQIERGAEFINFRNSQLTRELQSSLGKNCKVLMFVNVASEKTYAKETAATFEFAAQIKSSIKMETLDSKKTQLLKEKEFEFKSPGMSRPQKAAFGLNPPFSINIRNGTTKQGPSCTKKFDVAPACKKRKLYNNG